MHWRRRNREKTDTRLQDLYQQQHHSLQSFSKYPGWPQSRIDKQANGTEWRGQRDLFSSGNVRNETTVVSKRHYVFVKINCTTQRVNLNINYGLYLIIIYQYWLINKYTTLMKDFNKKRRHYINCSTFCKHKTALKKKSINF